MTSAHPEYGPRCRGDADSHAESERTTPTTLAHTTRIDGERRPNSVNVVAATTHTSAPGQRPTAPTTSASATPTNTRSLVWCPDRTEPLPYHRDMDDRPETAPPVPWGPAEYRRKVRRLGPLMSLAPPAALGLLAFVASTGSTSTLVHHQSEQYHPRK